MLVFGTIGKEIVREEGAVFRGADRGSTEAGGGRGASCRAHPQGGDQRADVLPLEQTVRGAGSGPGAADEATARREHALEAAGG